MSGSLIIKGNRYYAKFRVNGKQLMRSLDLDVKGNKRKAERKLQQMIMEYENRDIESEKIMFIPFLNQWLEKMKPILKPSTWESYDKTINGKVKPYFEDKKFRLREMKPDDFTNYFIYLATEGKSKGKGGLCYKSVKNIRGVLSSALDYAVKNKIIKYNTVTDSMMPSFPNNIKNDVPELNPQQIKALLNTAKENESHVYIFLLLVVNTGLRKGEALALTWDDVDYDKKLLNINKSMTGSRSAVTSMVTTPKTKSSNRRIPLSDFVLKELKAEKKRQDENKELFGSGYDSKNNTIVRSVLGERYKNLSAINRVVNRLLKDAGLPHCTIHGLRHSVASILDANGVALRDISILLGHESVKTTEQIYIRRDSTAKESTIQTLGAVLNLNSA